MVKVIKCFLNLKIVLMLLAGLAIGGYYVNSDAGNGIKVCTERQLSCDNGHCVPYNWLCEGEDDCGDGTDESPKICKRNCTSEEFKCKNGLCIALQLQCDGTKDCSDSSDEDERCQGKLYGCGEDKFECEADHCISNEKVCDGIVDCPAGNDESNCNNTCRPDEFTCSDGKCIMHQWVCDQDDDCGDGSDEFNCQVDSCDNTQQFHCVADNRCIPLKWRCDGEYDCTDYADEQDCPERVPLIPRCLPHEFACQDMTSCIHKGWLCDGQKDCLDGSDESLDLCKNVTCRPDQFQCDNKQCIAGYLQCSGAPECADASDEHDCGDKIRKCDPETEFDCGNSMCVPWSKTCDKHVDCPKAEDENTSLCNVNECVKDNGNCTHLCVDKPIGYECKCHTGYELIDQHACQDINECLIPGFCSQKCVNTKGSYKCDCVAGYMIDPNNKTRCKAIEGHASLLFSKRHDIRKVSLDYHDMSSIVNDTKSARALDFVFRTGMIFWSDLTERKIFKAPIDEGDEKTVVIPNELTTSDGLAVDWIYNHIYWTDSEKNSIELANFEGNMRKTLIKSYLEEPRGIAVNPLEGWLFWTDWGARPKIERCGLDGSHRSAIVTFDIKWPNGLTLDLVERRIYWVDAKLNTISSCKYDGSDRKLILYSNNHLLHPFSISTFEDWLYWTDWEKQTIYKANKFTGKDITNVTPLNTLHDPMVIHVYHPYRQPDGINHCAAVNGHCSHLCLPAPQINSKSPKITCACPNGLVLTKNGLMCTEREFGELDEDEVDGNQSGLIKDTESGVIAASVIIAVTILVIIFSMIAYIFYRYYLHKSIIKMNFENPVYRKTTEDQFSLQKNQYQPTRMTPPSHSFSDEPTEHLVQEPLTGNNDYV